MLKDISLRHLIPILFFSGGLILISAFYLIGYPAAREQAIDLAVTQARILAQSHQGPINDMLAINNTDQVRREIFFTASNPAVKFMIVVDENGIIRYGHRSRLIGKSIAEIDGNFDASKINRVAKTGAIDVVRNNDGSETITAYAGINFEDTPSNENWTMIIVSSYAKTAAQIVGIASFPSQLIASLIIILAIATAAILRQRLQSRLTPLLDSANALANGTTRIRAKLDGIDEFAELGRAFNAMAERIEANQQDLISARDEAERANKAKTAFLTNMSHEIRTPLSGIVGFLQLIKEVEVNNEAAIYVNSAETSALTLMHVINDILDISRLETGHFELAPEVFCLNALIQDIVDAILQQANTKGLYIRVTSNLDDPIWLESDLRIFRQILLNLIGNAVKFTEEGGVTIEIRADESDQNNWALNIAVKDTGIGIAEEDQRRLFEQFYQASGTEAYREGGAGLGLAICHDLSNFLGSKLTVQSEIGKGSVFSFIAEAPKAAPLNALSYEDLSKREQNTLNVLVVDDHDVNQKLLTSIMKKWGHEVMAVSNGEDAVDAVRERIIYPTNPMFDLVLMDINMPGMSGVETTTKIRSLASRMQALPIIAVTANVRPDGKEHYVAEGLDGYIPKPIDLKRLQEEIFRVTRLSSLV